MHDALENTNARARFRDAIARLNASVDAGRVVDAVRNVREARAALEQAAAADTDGSGDADRSAILLALDVASQELTNARRGAAGDAK
jgi:hypothetical protein